MTLKCKDCGFLKDVYEEDLMDNTACDICGGAMLTERDVDRLEELEKDKVVGDNFPQLNERVSKMEEAEIKNNLNMIGNNATWQCIEAIKDAKLRLRHRSIFFQLKGVMPEGGELR